MSRSIKYRLGIFVAVLLAVLLFMFVLVACTPTPTGEDVTTENVALGDVYVSDEHCVSCHGGSYETVAALTDQYGDSNPHNPTHGGYLACNVCHERDQELTYNWCEDCHTWPRPEQSSLK